MMLEAKGSPWRNTYEQKKCKMNRRQRLPQAPRKKLQTVEEGEKQEKECLKFADVYVCYIVNTKMLTWLLKQQCQIFTDSYIHIP